jgi:PEP-CTERM motif-containing protein
MRKIVLALFLVAAATVASANTLTLQPVLINHQYQQTTNNPCVIGDPSCNQPAGFGETIFPIASSYDSVSPVYTVAQINAITGGGFIIGVDINQTVDTQTLALFEMLINGVVVDTYSANPATLVPPTVGGGNGNGYADYILTNFTSLAGYKDTDTVQFHVIMPIVNDGREEYFLISAPAPPPVPEPSSLMLLGTGLVTAAGIVRKKFFS